jgi:hypothetical protein
MLSIDGLVNEVLSNAKNTGKEMTRAQALAHLGRHAEGLIRDGHVPAGTRVADIVAAINAEHAKLETSSCPG